MAKISKQKRAQLLKIAALRFKIYLRIQRGIEHAIMQLYSKWAEVQKISNVAAHLWSALKKKISEVVLSGTISLVSTLKVNIPKIFNYKISTERQQIISENLINVYRSKVAGFADSTVEGVRTAINSIFKQAAEQQLDDKDTMKLVKEAFKRISTSKSKLGAHLVTSEITAQSNESFAVEAKCTEKTWVYTYVAKQPRQHHVGLDGTTIGIKELFQVGNYTARYPHDVSLPLSEKANCHCMVSYS